MENPFFFDDIIVREQIVRSIHYTTNFGEDVEFDDTALTNYKINYDVLTSKKHKRECLIILQFEMFDKTIPEIVDDEPNEFQIVVEGHYEIPDSVPEREISDAIHFTGLSNLLAYLRTCVHSITSFCSAGPFYMPLIHIDELHKEFNKSVRKKNKK